MAGEEDLRHERIRREGELREDERCRRANQMECFFRHWDIVSP